MAYVSDHAVLRYLERVYHVDIEAVRAEMNTPGVDAAIAFDCDTVIMGNGARLKLVGSVVQSVFGKEMSDHHHRRHGVKRRG